MNGFIEQYAILVGQVLIGIMKFFYLTLAIIGALYLWGHLI